MLPRLVIFIVWTPALFYLVNGQAAKDMNFSTTIEPAGFFEPKWPYNESNINYKFEVEVNNSYVCKYGANIPGANMYQAVRTAAPCTYQTLQYHPEAYEFNHVLKGGALKWHIVLGNGSIIHGVTALGSSNMMPKGLSHIILNDNCVSTTFFHYFPTINPIIMRNIPAIVNMPSQFKVDTFGPTVGRKLTYTNLNLPDGFTTLDARCLKRCNLKARDFEPGGKRSTGLCTTLNAQGL